MTATIAGRETGTLVTGASGRLGRHLLSRLLGQDATGTVHLLVRDAGRASRRWLADLVRTIDDAQPRVAPIRIVEGDLEAPRLGLDPAAWKELARSVDRLVHMGGCADPGAPWHVCEATNVDGTERVLDLAAEASRGGHLTRFHHVSCAFVAGTTRGRISENDFAGSSPSDFLNARERSKYEAECRVRRSGIPFAIYRPSHMTSQRLRGWQRSSRLLGTILQEPVARLDVVPVGWVAEAISALMCGSPRGECFHLTAGPGRELPVIPGFEAACLGALAGRSPFRLWSLSLLRGTPMSGLYQDLDWSALDAVTPWRSYLRLDGPRFDNEHTQAALRAVGARPVPPA